MKKSDISITTDIAQFALDISCVGKDTHGYTRNLFLNEIIANYSFKNDDSILKFIDDVLCTLETKKIIICQSFLKKASFTCGENDVFFGSFFKYWTSDPVQAKAICSAMGYLELSKAVDDQMTLIDLDNFIKYLFNFFGEKDAYYTEILLSAFCLKVKFTNKGMKWLTSNKENFENIIAKKKLENKKSRLFIYEDIDETSGKVSVTESDRSDFMKVKGKQRSLIKMLWEANGQEVAYEDLAELALDYNKGKNKHAVKKVLAPLNKNFEKILKIESPFAETKSGISLPKDNPVTDFFEDKW